MYFVGTARRGEDGDQTKNRRQPKPTKPKKFSKVEGITMVDIACNSGTSGMVNKDGELYIFGKDSTHADYSTGIVSELKGKGLVQVRKGQQRNLTAFQTVF